MKVWWTAGAQPPQLLSSGELALSSAWNGRVLALMKENAPVAMTFSDGIVWGNAWEVLKGSPQEKVAMERIKEGLNKPSKSRSAITSLAFGDTITTKFGFSSAATRVSGRNVAFSGAAGATIPSSPTTVVEPSTDSTARTA